MVPGLIVLLADTQASSVKDIETAVALFRLVYDSGSEEHCWELSLDGPKVEVADWLRKINP
jgi:hypothetical protein